jgi:hypothetical protein
MVRYKGCKEVTERQTLRREKKGIYRLWLMDDIESDLRNMGEMTEEIRVILLLLL